MKRKLIVGISVLSMIFVTNASAIVAMFPIQIVQWMTAELGHIADIAEEVSTTENTMNTVQNGLRQIQQAEQELKSLSPSQLAQYNRYIDQLGSIMSQTNGMAYNMAQIDTAFTTNFPEYDELLSKGKNGDIKLQGKTYADMYKSLLDKNRGTALGTLQSLKKTSDYLDSDNATLDSLKATSNNASGNLQAIQAANQIAIHQTETLKDLHRTMLSQQSLMVQSLATENERIAARQAQTTAWKENSLKPTKGDEHSVKTWRE